MISEFGVEKEDVPKHGVDGMNELTDPTEKTLIFNADTLSLPIHPYCIHVR